ncbi:MAG: class I SAM-dependent methyltransferase [Candidatus Metalachnospira sp.]|nr:class I SAM-dependent methyltransferase [Candidatus Metalachnospira sp.]
MEISERLKTVASFVRDSRSIADIGTDHGYIPIYLYKEGIIDRAIACDINRDPIKRAENNINMYHLGNVIETRLGNGLNPIKAGETDGIVIAGIGGMLMIDILRTFPDKLEAAKEIILQPQSDIESVRKFLHLRDFKIDDEQMLYEDGIYYTVIRAVSGNEEYENRKDYIFGKINIDKKSSVLKDYLYETIRKNDNIAQSLKKADTENSAKRLDELTEYQIMCKEVYECL